MYLYEKRSSEPKCHTLLASPSSGGGDYMCVINCMKARATSFSYSESKGECPIVSMKCSVVLREID